MRPCITGAPPVPGVQNSVTAHLLSILVFLPTLGAIATLFARSRDAVRWTALSTTLLTLVFSLGLFFVFSFGSGTAQLVEIASWIPSFNVEYKLGIDGLSLPLIILTTFISVLACIASWNITKMTRGYMALFLFLETGILGVFCSLDFFLFYVFFEVSLLPMYFLIGIWGGPRKEYAAIKFFLYTLVGSIGLLIVLIGTYLYTRSIVPGGTFDLVKLSSPQMREALRAAGLSGFVARTFFLLAMLAFLIKLPAVPFHTWLPDAHVEAPTPISMILAALLLKLGGYGVFRVAYPLFPDIAREMWLLIAIVGVVSIIYGALCAMSQTDFKRLVAYSSISHMGYVLLGAAMMTDTAMHGAMFMMVAHGITSAMMFFLVGVVYDRAHHRELPRLGGLASTMPVYAGFSIVGFFATLGLPGLCGFVGEVLVLIGSFSAASGSGAKTLVSMGYASAAQIYTLSIIACFGLILTAGYMLWAMQRIFFGSEREEYKAFPEIDRREVLVLTPLAVMAIALGILPSMLFFVFTSATVTAMMKLFN